jgi:hypothetical protein
MGTDSPKASSRLREMEIESEIEEHELQTALAGESRIAAPLEIAIKQSSRSRVADGSDERDKESLLRRKQPNVRMALPALCPERRPCRLQVAFTCFSLPQAGMRDFSHQQNGMQNLRNTEF